MAKKITDEQKKIAELKIKFLSYYADLPNQRLAAAKIGRSEDTIHVWKKNDSGFSAQVDEAKADWALKQTKGVRSKEWLLERVLRDDFSQRQELTGKDGEKIQIGGFNYIVPNAKGDNPSASTDT